MVWMTRLWPSMLALARVVQPATILRWHRAGFRTYWRWKSQGRSGRPRIEHELRDLIRRMSKENPLWGAPRIHGELLKLGFEVAESIVSKYMIGRRGRGPHRAHISIPQFPGSACLRAASRRARRDRRPSPRYQLRLGSRDRLAEHQEDQGTARKRFHHGEQDRPHVPVMTRVVTVFGGTGFLGRRIVE